MANSRSVCARSVWFRPGGGEGGLLVRFAIVPTILETGYFYFKPAEPLRHDTAEPIDRSVEKAFRATAEALLASSL
jgi:mannose-1-phosphate guanylyltransferase